MLKSIWAIALLSPAAIVLPIITTHVPAQAQVSSQAPRLDELYTDLQAAVCQNDWDRALRYISPIIASSELTARSRMEFIEFRQQLQDWRATRATVANIPNCPEAIAQLSPSDRAPEPTQAPRQPIDWQRATRPVQGRQPSSGPRDRPDQPDAVSQAQCSQLGEVIGRADAAAISSYQGANFTDISSLLQTMSQLATISERTVVDLQSLSLSDARLQIYAGSFAAMYTGFSQSARDFVAAFNLGNTWRLDASIAEMEGLSSQGVALSNQVNAYCGWNVITLYEFQSE